MARPASPGRQCSLALATAFIAPFAIACDRSPDPVGGSTSSSGSSSTSSSGSSSSSSSGSSSDAEKEDCKGRLEGAVSGDVGTCRQTASTETTPEGVRGKTTHSFLAVVGDHQVMVSFSFAEETPAAGTYDRSNLVDYGVYVDAIAYTASFDTKYPSKATGSISVHLTGGTGAKLTGTLDGVAPPGPLAGGGGAGEVKVHLEFPP